MWRWAETFCIRCQLEAEHCPFHQPSESSFVLTRFTSTSLWQVEVYIHLNLYGGFYEPHVTFFSLKLIPRACYSWDSGRSDQTIESVLMQFAAIERHNSEESLLCCLLSIMIFSFFAVGFSDSLKVVDHLNCVKPWSLFIIMKLHPDLLVSFTDATVLVKVWVSLTAPGFMLLHHCLTASNIHNVVILNFWFVMNLMEYI